MSTTALTLALTTITEDDKKTLDGLIKAESDRAAIRNATPARSDEEQTLFLQEEAKKEARYRRNMARAGFGNNY